MKIFTKQGWTLTVDGRLEHEAAKAVVTSVEKMSSIELMQALNKDGSPIKRVNNKGEEMSLFSNWREGVYTYISKSTVLEKGIAVRRTVPDEDDVASRLVLVFTPRKPAKQVAVTDKELKDLDF
jgi:hypothetical protein